MTRERVLIAVKTYPTLSNKYIELVCTAGFREDGSWIRIYPSPFRFLSDDKQYKKYQWISLDLEKNPADPRPESYRPTNIDDIKLGTLIGTGKDRQWQERRRLILQNNRIYTNLDEIIGAAKNNEYSLAIFKPKEIIDFTAEPTSTDWKPTKKEIAEAALKQGSLFAKTEKYDLKLMPKLPYKFKYTFLDDQNKKSSLMIEDWEIGMLYWNCLEDSNTEQALKKVREMYLDNFARQKDLYLFLGTTKEWHSRSPNPYIIIGTFHPPFEIQTSLF